MLTAEENALLTRVGPGTPMGELYRRYWLPIAASSQLQDRGTRPVRLLGEDLVLYRDRSGGLGLIADRCPHRRAGMVFGVPESNGLRCAYHGWLWAADGRCLDQPYEITEDPAGTLKDRVTIKAYPVTERAGMIWAYLGPSPAPLFPNYDLFLWDDVMRDIGGAVIPCNWLQVMENSLDPVHVEWLHTYFSNYALERLGRTDLKRSLVNGGTLEFRHARIAFDVFEHGIIKKRLLVGMSEEDDGWAVGHPIIFPNILRVGNAFQMRVPIDDTHTYHWWYTCHRARPGFEVTHQDAIPFYEVPVPTLDERGEPQWSLVDNNSGQDIAMWYTQGDVADRTQENLGLSDKGVNLYRRMLEANVARVQRGEDPMNVFRNPSGNQLIEFHTEQQLFSTGESRVTRTGQAGKYSPLLREAAKATEGEQSLAEPVH